MDIENAAQQLLNVLEKTVSQNPQDQKSALEFLNQASVQDFPTFVQCLAMILNTGACQSYVRQAAGIQLKNALSAKDDDTRNTCIQRWVSLPEATRSAIKQSVVSTLGTEPYHPSIAAQCVKAIACAELPTGLWPDVISVLMGNVTNGSSGEMLKQSSLEALGYICSEIDAAVLEKQANQILTAIVHGMRKEETSGNVRLAATTALQNSLEFTKSNFSNERERHVIMQVVCETTQSTDMRVKVAALQCLVRIMSLYYQFMEQYMTALFPITVQAIKSDEADVTLQGIEFWSNVAEEEISLSVEAEIAAENNRVPERVSRHYAKGAVVHLCPLLLETLAKHDEADDEDDWTPSKAAGVCVMLLAQCVGDTILDCVMPFFQHFSSNDWKYKEAAIMAFGSILDGPDPSKLTPLVQQAVPALINSMADSNVSVRDTTAWTIGRVLEVCPSIVTDAALRDSLLQAMSQGLAQEPRVATNVCWAIVALVKAAYEAAREEGTDGTGQPETYALSHVYQGMINELVRVTDRPDANQSNLRLAAFETLMELIKDSPKDCYQHVQSTTMLMLTKLEQLLNMEINSTNQSDKNQLVDLQALLCATLQSVLRRLRSEDAPVVGEPIMKGLLQIMSRSTGKGGNVMEEALLAVSTLVETLGQNFEPYMPLLKPHLLAGLTNHEEAQVCAAAVGVVADLCRALEAKMAPHLNEMMELLVMCLQHQKVPRDVKVTILSCFGDIALAIGPHFESYLPVVMNMLQAASNAAIITNVEDQDQADYVDSLRDACINAYTGILQAARPGDNEPAERQQHAKQAFAAYVNPMIEMILKCCDMTPVPPSDTLMSSVCGLVGDLVCMYGQEILPALNNDKVNNLINKARRSRVGKTKATANWAFKELRKVMPKASDINFAFKSG